MWPKLYQSPLVLSLLVSVYPMAFFISNNWFMFEASRSILIFGMFSIIVFLMLSAFYFVLSWLIKKLSRNNHTVIVQRTFVFVSIIVLGYLLRHTFVEMVENKFYLILMIGSTAAVVGWFTPMIQIFRINAILMILCLVNLGSGVYSILTAETTAFANKHDNELHQSMSSTVSFSKKPNVYYIVPDGYPSEEALQKVYNLDNTEFYQELESSGFTLYHSAFSNYMNTLASIGSAFNMAHHLYQGSVGSFEMLNSREFIVSDRNPVVQIFKRNGYQIHFLHQVGYMFTRGCFIDFCFPDVFWGTQLDILMPWALQNALGMVVDESLNGFEQRLLQHIDGTSKSDTPHFLYVHILSPAHSDYLKQSPEELRTHRQEFSKKIRSSNEVVNNIVRRILQHDPTGLIIINADHGSWGLGVANVVDDEDYEGLSDDLIAIDHLGVLLAIRWPNSPPKNDLDIRTNVNVFRYVFAYLTQDENILATKKPDHGYILKGKQHNPMVVEVVRDGKALKHMVELNQEGYLAPLR